MKLLRFFSLLYSAIMEQYNENQIIRHQQARIAYLEDMLLSAKEMGEPIPFSPYQVNSEAQTILHRKTAEKIHADLLRGVF